MSARRRAVAPPHRRPPPKQTIRNAVPARPERLAGLQERAGLRGPEPLDVPLPSSLAGLLADEELQVRCRIRTPVAVHVGLPLVELCQGAAHLFDGGRGLAGLADRQEHSAKLVPQDAVPGYVPDPGVRPGDQPVLVRRRGAVAQVAEHHLLIEERREGLPHRGVCLTGGLRASLRERLTQVYASHPEPVEVPDQILGVLLRGDDAGDAGRVHGPDEEPPLLAVPRIRRGDRGSAHGVTIGRFAHRGEVFSIGRVSGRRSGSGPSSRRTRSSTGLPRWRYCPSQVSNSDLRTSTFRPGR
jgi:hypothetical protein